MAMAAATVLLPEPFGPAEEYKFYSCQLSAPASKRRTDDLVKASQQGELVSELRIDVTLTMFKFGPGWHSVLL